MPAANDVQWLVDTVAERLRRSGKDGDGSSVPALLHEIADTCAHRWQLLIFRLTGCRLRVHWSSPPTAATRTGPSVDGYRDFLAEVNRYPDSLPSAYAPIHGGHAATADGTTYGAVGFVGPRARRGP